MHRMAKPRLRGVARWKLLAEASALLDSSLEYEVTLRNVVGLAVPAVADFCTVLLVDERGKPTYGAGAARDSATEQVLQRMADYSHVCLTPGHPIGETLESRVPRVFTVTRASIQHFAEDDAHLATLLALDPHHVLVVPLLDRDRMLGVLVLGTVRGTRRRLRAQDIALGEQLGKRAALAIAHARMFKAAQRASRAREQLLATLSHDLKTPIGTMRMAVDFALDLLSNDQEHRQIRSTLASGRRAADRMLRLVHDLLDVSAIEAGRLMIRRVPDDASALVAETVDAHRLIADAKHVRLDAEVEHNLPHVLADHERLLQALANLTGNAVKFTPSGGRVRIAASQMDDDVHFVITDTGPGIAATELPYIFDRFWRANGRGQSGTGLGLAIARGIVEAHGGTITVRSQPGMGSEFVLTIPGYRPPDRHSEQHVMVRHDHGRVSMEAAT